MDYKLRCIKCGNEYRSDYRRQTCESCNGLLYINVKVSQSIEAKEYRIRLPK